MKKVEGVPDKKALVGLKEAKRKLYREVTGRKEVSKKEEDIA